MTTLAACLALAALGAPSTDMVGEGWAEAYVLAPGPERGALVAELLAASDAELDDDSQRLAYECATRAADALELELALAIQEPLHGRVGAVWSGYNLAVTRHRSGDSAGADALLGALLVDAGLGDRANLWNQRAIFALGDGRRVEAWAAFGHAMGLGSADATAILAREDLAGHNLHRAKSGFRAALNRTPDHPWALRGWGLALLSAPQPRD